MMVLRRVTRFYRAERAVTPNHRRIPGEKNPVADSSEIDQISNAAMSSQMQGTSNGAAGGLLDLFATFRARKAKKRAIAAWEAQRRDQQE
jgi:hypothetical protein